MGNTYLKETSKTHRANDDMALSSHNTQIKRRRNEKEVLITSLYQSTLLRFFLIT